VMPLSCVQIFQLKMKRLIGEVHFIRHSKVLLITLSLLTLMYIACFQTEKNIKERVYESGKDLTCIVEIYCYLHVTEKI